MVATFDWGQQLIIRTAFFEGTVRTACEAEFDRMLRTELMPLWQSFPGAIDIRLSRPVAADVDAPAYAIMLTTSYPDLATMEKALASNIREQTRGPTERLKALFDGRVFHITFETVPSDQGD